MKIFADLVQTASLYVCVTCGELNVLVHTCVIKRVQDSMRRHFVTSQENCVENVVVVLSRFHGFLLRDEKQ